MKNVKKNLRKADYVSRVVFGAVVFFSLISNVGPTPFMLVLTLFSIPVVLSGYLGLNSMRFGHAERSASSSLSPELVLVSSSTPAAVTPVTWRQAA